MKNIFTYISPKKELDKEASILAKVQIDNSLDLGWKPEDIIFITNFPYEYNGANALVIGDDAFCDYSPISTKVFVILKLFELGLIKDELYWMHDLDAFQCVAIPESEIDLGEADMALCALARMPKWAGGSVFFKKSARDIFGKWKEAMDVYKVVDEVVLTKITNEDAELKKRIKLNNISYNFVMYNLSSCYKMALKPIRVAHFHPFGGKVKIGIPNMLKFYKGENKLGIPLIPDRLINIFNKYEII